MLWWVPPTPVTLVLRLEKSKSRHAHHALETTQLRSTCILGKKNTLPTRRVRVFELYAATVDFRPPQNPTKMKNKKGRGGRGKSKVTYADWLNHSSQNMFSCSWRGDADERRAFGKRQLCELSKVPRCGPRWPVRCTHGSAARWKSRARLPLADKVRSAALLDRPHPQRAESGEWRFRGWGGGDGTGGTGEIIKRCSAQESTPTPPEWCD